MAAIGDVSSTLLLRYYGSKTALFEAALIEAMPIGDLLATTERSQFGEVLARAFLDTRLDIKPPSIIALATGDADARDRSEEHTSELQSLMRISYAVLCLKTKNIHIPSID